MPVKSGRYTAQERVFIEHAAATGDRTYAATKAGYVQPAVKGCVVGNRPAVQAEIARIQQQRLFEECLPLAINRLVSILHSDKAPAGAQVQAARLVLDRTLGTDEAGRVKAPHEMTGDELAKAIEELKRRAADKAKPVIDAEPLPPGDLFE